MVGSKRLVRTSREEKATFDLYEPEAGPLEVYVDGFSGGRSDASITRLDFHVTTGIHSEDNSVIEERTTRLRIIIPTEKWLETLSIFVRNARTNAGSFSAAMEQSQKRMHDALLTVVGDGTKTKGEK
jgi:hypothetical protein